MREFARTLRHSGLSLIRPDGKDINDMARVYLTNMEERNSTEKYVLNPAGLPGQRLISARRTGLETDLTLFLKEPDPEKRISLMSGVLAFFRPGMYRSGQRPDQELQVDHISCAQTPPLMAWTNTLKLTLLSLTIPYWQGMRQEVSGEMRSGELRFTPEGHTERVCLEVEVTNLSARDMDSIELENGDSEGRICWMSFSGLQLRPGESFRLFYDQWHVLRIFSGERSALMARSAASWDEMTARVGRENIFGVDMSGKGRVSVSWRPLYL